MDPYAGSREYRFLRLFTDEGDKAAPPKPNSHTFAPLQTKLICYLYTDILCCMLAHMQ